MEQYIDAISRGLSFSEYLAEKKLTPAEKKKREEIAKAIEKENPDMPMDKKMAIATAQAKKVAEESEQSYKEFFKSALKKFGVSEPDQLKREKKKEFFDYVDANWKADKETD